MENVNKTSPDHGIQGNHKIQITHADRVKKALKRETGDRVPMSFGATGEMSKKLLDYVGPDVDREKLLYSIFDVDIRGADASYVGPELKKYEDGSYDNWFGGRMQNKEYDGGVYAEFVTHPLDKATTIEEIEEYSLPPMEWFDFTKIKEPLSQYPDYAFTIGYFALGWYSWELRGMSTFLEDLLVRPDIAGALIEKMADWGYQFIKNMVNAGKDYIGKNYLCVHLADDWATQDSLLISPELYRKYFKRHYQKIINMAHDAGLSVEFHCCGSAIGLIPELIDTGIDILNPIQTSATGMVPHELKEKFGKDLIFSGGVDVQQVLPLEDPDSVKKEVKYLLDTLGKDGGYILGPSHAIQVGTPPENIIAMYEAVYEYYGLSNKYLPLKK